MAIGIDWDGGRQMLATAAELGSREGHPAWKSFVIGQKQRSLRWVHFLVTDQHEGLKNAVADGPTHRVVAALLYSPPAQQPKLYAWVEAIRILTSAVFASTQCLGTTRAGNQCKNKVSSGS